MTVKSKPRRSPRERWRRWKEEFRYGVEMTRADINKFSKLTKILGMDMGNLGLGRIAVTIIPRRRKYVAFAGSQTLRVEGKAKVRFPRQVSLEYRGFKDLSVQELRSVAWHEFGHFIFSKYYPSIDEKYRSKSGKEYEVSEAFANEFAFRKFGNVYVRASRKYFEAMGIPEKDIKKDIKHLNDMRQHIKENGYGYWKQIARELDIPIKFAPRSSIMMGVNPKKHVLGSLR